MSIAAIDAALALSAFLGHFALAVYLFNRLHTLAWNWRLIKICERLLLLAAAVVLAAYCSRSYLAGAFGAGLSGPWLWYAGICWVCAALVLPLWLVPKLTARVPDLLLASDTQVIDVAAKLGHKPVAGWKANLYARFPGTEIFRLHVQRKVLRVPGLPPELDGLTIAHLSDLHMTGALTEDFYRAIVSATNELAPDLVVITGDILEKPRCLPWVASTLARLDSRYGKFFILGNHELRLGDVAPLRQALVSANFVDLGGRTRELAIEGARVLLAGTELPWFGAAPEIEVLGTKYSVLSTDSLMPESASNPQSAIPNPKSPFRLLLSHSPDQLPWARANGFQLMLAGHNHGGQIRLPWLGALITPSRYGFRYAGGLYHEPPTVLHVSRGLSGVPPIRLNCPPEIALLVLRSA